MSNKSIAPRVTIEIKNLKNIDKMIKRISRANKDNISLNKYIKKMILKTYISVMNRELVGGTTNDDSISLYKKSYHIKDTEDGFILYNNALIPQSEIKSKNKQSYPNGFSIAMAFEYGVGIVGISTGNPNAWDYNVHGYEEGWFYPEHINKGFINKKSFAKKYEFTSGYKGLEIFRKTKIEVESNLSNWIKEYYEKRKW